jgi:GAF domain-containing protein
LSLTDIEDEVRDWRARTVARLMRVLMVLGGLAVVGAGYTEYQRGALGNVFIFVGVYALLALITFWRRVPYGLRAGTLLLIFLALGVFTTLNSGLSGDGGIFFLTFAAAAALFFGARISVVALGVSLVSFLGMGWLFSQEILVVPADELIFVNTDFGSWLSTTIIFAMLGILLITSERRLFSRLIDALRQSRALASDVEGARMDLEVRVAERTADLERRTRYLEATAAVARGASALLADSEQLLTQMADLISRELQFYHAGIFFTDPDAEWATLVAASSEGGQRMLARNHRLRVGQQGIVGYVAASGQYRLALDVGQDAVFFDNPDLPRTRSEIALPLRIRDEVIGVLDVQSTVPAAFSDEDVVVLQVLADQVAMAINSNRLFNQVQASAEAERRTYQQLSADAWRELLAQERDLGFISNAEETLPAGNLWRPEMAAALRKRDVVVNQDGAEAGGQTIALPITVRGEVVGVIDGRKPEGEPAWTQDEIALIQSFVEQLQVALEGARLYREAQLMAVREQLIREITDEMGRAGDLSSLMRITAEALNQRLGGDRIYVRLTANDQASMGDGAAGS